MNVPQRRAMSYMTPAFAAPATPPGPASHIHAHTYPYIDMYSIIIVWPRPPARLLIFTRIRTRMETCTVLLSCGHAPRPGFSYSRADALALTPLSLPRGTLRGHVTSSMTPAFAVQRDTNVPQECTLSYMTPRFRCHEGHLSVKSFLTPSFAVPRDT